MVLEEVVDVDTQLGRVARVKGVLRIDEGGHAAPALGLGLLFAALLGLASGALPAVAAMRLRIVDALRGN